MRKSPDMLPWQQLMEIAFGVLELSPEIFWAMTPVEWIAAYSGWRRKNGIAEDAILSIGSDELAALRERFPDRIIAAERY